MSEFGHDIEICNCDQCRYWRWGMTLIIESIEPAPFRESASSFLEREKRNYEANFKRFLERESAGEIKSPSGPFTKENGWDVDPEHGIVCWGGGLVT